MVILEIITLAFFVVAFTIIILKHRFFKIAQAKQSLVLSLWVYKMIAGIIFFLMYSLYTPYSKGSDSDVYFADSKILSSVFKESPLDYLTILSGCYSDESMFYKYTSKMEYWNRSYPSVVPNDNRIVIRVNSILSFFSFGFYSVHLLLMAFISFTGLFYLYKAVKDKFPLHQIGILLTVFIIPSTVFWSAGVLKEPIILFLLGFFVYHIFKISKKKYSIRILSSIFITSFLMIFTKPYILFILIPITIAFLIAEFVEIKKKYLIYLSVLLLFFLSLVILSNVKPELSLAQLLTTKQSDFLNMNSASNSGGYFVIPLLDNTNFSLLKNSPTAIMNSLSRPWIWEFKTWPQLIAAIENFVFLCLVIGLLIRFKFHKIEQQNIALFAISFSILLFIISGLTTPNMGALVRYKSLGLPFLLIFLISGSTPIRNFKYSLIQNINTNLNSFFWKKSQE